MPKQGRQAGQNIRELALKRRVKAITSFIAAGCIILLPLILIRALDDLLQSLTSTNSSEPQSSLDMPPIFYVMLIAIALGLVANGFALWKRANRADQGAKGEESTAQVLEQLEKEGWKVEYGMRLGNKLGDADIVCISPKNKVYVIDVKSHKGKVIREGEQLQRYIGATKYSFEKDFISQVMKQALQVKKQKGFKFVTPVLAFSDAQVSLPSGQLRNVYVVEKKRLASLLKSLG
ncbi:MAG: nuclease-related domain-containing protein [Leptolyngbyaceae bacterium]|nr:nuclease-related domain-containing protein [Leptolyngbyaceae bacterium]